MNLLLNILVSLVSGSLGSWLLAQPAARRSEIARTRYQAATTLRGKINAYCHELRYQRERVRAEGAFPAEFASLAQQERFAEEVLALMADLPDKLRAKLRPLLSEVVGPTALAFAEGRMYVPADNRSDALESGRRETLERRFSSLPDQYADGLLPKLLAFQNNHEALEAAYVGALSRLDFMADLVHP